MNIFSGLRGLENGIAASWKRNAVILDNVANVDTPDFKASELQFEAYYKRALDAQESEFTPRRTRPTHLFPSEFDGGYRVVTAENTTQRMDGNNVDIDKEMTDYAKNVIYYNTLQRKINGQITQLRTAIKGQ